MAVTIKNIIPSKEAEAVQTTQYTAINVTTIIDKFTATNTSTSNATLNVNLVISSGSPSNPNLIVKEVSLTPKETYLFPELIGHVLESGDFISTLSSASSAITIRASGREVN